MPKKIEPYVVSIDADGTRTVISGSAQETLLAGFDQFLHEEVIRQVRAAKRIDSPIARPAPRNIEYAKAAEAAPPICAVLTTEDLAEILKCSPESIAKMVDAGHIPQPHQLGDLQRWLRSEIDGWIAGGMKPVGRQRRKAVSSATKKHRKTDNR
jgi:predicted DNA-binding transcriptional regulator AlpA